MTTITITLTDEQLAALENRRTAQPAPQLRAEPLTLEQYAQQVFDGAMLHVVASYRRTLLQRVDAINAAEIAPAQLPALLKEIEPILEKYRKESANGRGVDAVRAGSADD